MGTSISVCYRREDSRECCDLNTSFLGEDAFIRDNFYDCEEGDSSHDNLFKQPNQVSLKLRKASVVGDYVRFTAKKNFAVCSSRTKDGSPPSHRSSVFAERLEMLRERGVQDSAWLNATLPMWPGKDFPELGDGPYWGKGDGTGLMVRNGPNYTRHRSKIASSWSMYEALSIDSLRCDRKIESVIGNIISEDELPCLRSNEGIPDYGGGKELQWKRGCALPRLLCINLMLPYETGVNPFGKDHGCSVIGFFQIKPETLHALQHPESAPPCVKLFQEFYEGPAGKPGGSLNDPDRCLDRRVKSVPKKKDLQSGLFKAVAQCENPQDVNIPKSLTEYNGKPCLITKSGYIVKDPNGVWLEIGVDVRRFNVFARTCLSSFRKWLPHAKIHYGFWIQAIEDECMPEGLLCDLYCHHFNMMDDPVPLK